MTYGPVFHQNNTHMKSFMSYRFINVFVCLCYIRDLLTGQLYVKHRVLRLFSIGVTSKYWSVPFSSSGFRRKTGRSSNRSFYTF